MSNKKIGVGIPPKPKGLGLLPKTLMKKITCLLLVLLCTFSIFCGCNTRSREPIASSGVKPTQVDVPVNAEGITVEQQNIRERLLMDNEVGSIKHLYVISAYSGQTIIYSTVRGKVTSSSKRLSPTAVVGASGEYRRPGFSTGQDKMVTDEVVQDDGTYGSSIPYLYWWDTKGVYHQHYVSGGQIIHVSNEPVSVKSVVINMAIEESTE